MDKKYLFLLGFLGSVAIALANDILPPDNPGTQSWVKNRSNNYWKRKLGLVDYLPLSGGTLTGSLYGTVASFSGVINANATGANIRLYADGTGANDGFLGSGNDGTLYFRNWDGTRGLVIKPSGDIYYDGGKFGIGIASPAYKFEVVSPNSLGIRLQTSGSSVGAPQIDLYDASKAHETVISSTDGAVTGTYIASYSNHPLLFGTNHSASQMSLTTNGNLGIGTNTPGLIPNGTASGSVAKLEVNGNIRINTMSMAGSGEIGNLQFLKAHTATLNTTYSTAEVRAFTTSGYNGGLRIYTNQHIGNGDYDLRPVMTLGPDGNVGIGNNSPIHRLQISGGDIAFDAEKTERFIRINNSYGGAIRFRGNATTSSDRGLQFGRIDGNNIWSPLMTIETNNGNVGVGIEQPSEKFTVNGNVKAKKVIVSQSGWPDYVFDSSYSLRSLASVNEFIKQHKRLPEIPSANEVEEKGISIGDNQALLLKKIEELTLYLIKQDAKIELLTRQVQDLKEENEKIKKAISKPALNKR